MHYPSSHFATALHEARHCAYAASVGFDVLEVDIPRGYASIILPFPSYGLQALWDADPRGTQQQLEHIIGAIVAPMAAEGRHFPARCGDSDLLERYRVGWAHVRPTRPTAPPPPPWMDLLTRARSQVQHWAKTPGGLAAIYTLATWLARDGHVDEKEWNFLWSMRFTAPLRPPVTPTRPVPARAAAPARPARPPAAPDYPLGPSDIWWFRTHRRRPVARPPVIPDVGPVPLDWRTGLMPFSLRGGGLHAV